MFIAQQFKKQNIVEYVLYMWQVEDIIRAYGCSLPRLRSEYIPQFDYDDEQKEELVDWYAMLIKQMNDEGCREKGHLSTNKTLVERLEKLHQQLSNDSEKPFYKAQYYKVLPFIVELRNKRGERHTKPHTAETEVETCLNALYGVMMLRLQKKEISPDTKHAIEAISTLMGMLAEEYGSNGKANSNE